MIRATRRTRSSEGEGSRVVDRIALCYDDRRRRRFAMKGEGGFEFLLDLPETTTLRGGDFLVLENGWLIEVIAAHEELTEARTASSLELARLAWHLGNRHLEAALMDECRLRVRRDPIVKDLMRKLGATVTDIDDVFEPEGGAYASGAH